MCLIALVVLLGVVGGALYGLVLAFLAAPIATGAGLALVLLAALGARRRRRRRADDADEDADGDADDAGEHAG